jgi:hypothetical protein
VRIKRALWVLPITTQRYGLKLEGRGSNCNFIDDFNVKKIILGEGRVRGGRGDEMR